MKIDRFQFKKRIRALCLRRDDAETRVIYFDIPSARVPRRAYNVSHVGSLKLYSSAVDFLRENVKITKFLRRTSYILTLQRMSRWPLAKT